jgi:hypothetical protein
MDYDPNSVEDRKKLGERLTSTLAEKGFVSKKESNVEETFDFKVDKPGMSGFYIRVYTSIVNGIAREDGEDAIRIVLLWKNVKKDSFTPISKSTRVNRTGEIEKIVERTLSRARELWGKMSEVKRCHCGAPKILSSKEKLYCVNICWKD